MFVEWPLFQETLPALKNSWLQPWLLIFDRVVNTPLLLKLNTITQWATTFCSSVFIVNFVQVNASWVVEECHFDVFMWKLNTTVYGVGGRNETLSGFL